MDNQMKYNNYTNQGMTSRVLNNIEHLESFPKEIKDICSALNKFVLIDFLPNMGIVGAPKEHLNDSNIRDVNDKLEIIVKRNGLSLNDQNPHDKMLLGNCRDLSLLMCSILRHHKIPARVRSGFGTFFHPLKKFDHWVCEYWNSDDKRWVRVDPWMAQIKYYKDILPDYLRDGLLSIDYNEYDVNEVYYYPGATAWLNCRKDNDDFNSYGTYEEELKGEWFVRDNMIRDLLCLVKYEPLPWDCWGKMGREYKQMSNIEFESLDMLAEHITKNTITREIAQEVLKNFNMNLSNFTN